MGDKHFALLTLVAEHGPERQGRRRESNGALRNCNPLEIRKKGRGLMFWSVSRHSVAGRKKENLFTLPLLAMLQQRAGGERRGTGGKSCRISNA